jgi:hypothetical protein
MRLVKDRVPHGTQRGGRDGAELDHDSHLPDSSRAQSSASGGWTRVERAGAAGAGVVAGLVSDAR